MKYLFSSIMICCSLLLVAQKKESDFYDSIKMYNLSEVLNPDSVTDGYTMYGYTEPLGFIGSNYQRFRIHFGSIIKEQDEPYTYRVLGKTMAYDTVRPFVGYLHVISAVLMKDNASMLDIDSSSYKEGYFIAELELNEDFVYANSGFIKGKLVTSFVIDTNGKMLYNALSRYSDNFSNNQFVGTWNSYKGHVVKKCNWGNRNIPESGDLNVGAGEFVPNEKYKSNGWLGYLNVYNSGIKEDYQLLLQKELYWWRKR